MFCHTEEKQFFNENNTIDLSKFEDVERFTPKNEFSVFKIDFSEEISEFLSLFRGILNSKEVSYRSLAVSSAIIVISSSNAAAWWLREKCIEKLSISVENEDSFIENITKLNSKSYQLWNYRFWFVTSIKKAFDAEKLERDISLCPRNFHAWNFLLKIASYYKNYEDCIEITTKFIDANSKNNSAWNARNTLFEECPGIFNAEKELEYSVGKLETCGGNVAVCNYIRSVLAKNPSNIKVLEEKIKLIYNENPFDVSLLTLSIDLTINNNDLDTKQMLIQRLISIDSTKLKFWRSFYK